MLSLLDRYAEDAGAVWRYGHALVTFRREGDSAVARDRLREALRANRRVAKYLDGAAALPDQDPETYEFGSEEEAVIAARTLTETRLTAVAKVFPTKGYAASVQDIADEVVVKEPIARRRRSCAGPQPSEAAPPLLTAVRFAMAADIGDAGFPSIRAAVEVHRREVATYGVRLNVRAS